MTRRWLRAIPVLLISAGALLAAQVPAGATTLTWSVVPSPSPGSGYNILTAVSCVSPAVCTAVGYDREDTAPYAFHALTESWNGTRWAVVHSPTPNGSLYLELTGVSCVSAAACTAVGSDYENPQTQQTLAESWNGTAWSVVPSPNRPSSNVLDGVSCVSATACTAVGDHGDRHSTRALIESWNGTTWSLVTSPNPGSDYDDLYGVSCPAAAACTAVGKYINSGGEQTLIESWNGTKPTVTRSPSPGTVDMLNGVSCVSTATCTAAGSNGRNSQSSPETLIESGR